LRITQKQRTMIRVANRQRRIPLNVGIYRTLAERILRHLGRPDVEVGLSFIGDRRIRQLNRTYRGKDRPTDVLSFQLSPEHFRRPSAGTLGEHPSRKRVPSVGPARKTGSGGRPPVLLGDVVISVPTARRQARDMGHSLRREISWLMIHGVLHLFGYDHEKPADARRMRRKERALLQALALPA